MKNLPRKTTKIHSSGWAPRAGGGAVDLAGIPDSGCLILQPQGVQQTGSCFGEPAADLLMTGPFQLLQGLLMATETGRPISNIRFRTLQAISVSAFCAFGSRARSRSPMIDLYLKKVFSTVPWRW